MSRENLNIDPLKALRFLGKNRPTNITAGMMRQDPMDAYPKSDLHPPPVNIMVAPQYQGINRQGVVLDDLKIATKGDGTIRKSYFEGGPIPREYVEDAMFRNQDFMYRTDQFPMLEKPELVDQVLKRQRSHFGPMPPNPLGLGFDVIRDRGDTSISVAQTGGRYEE